MPEDDRDIQQVNALPPSPLNATEIIADIYTPSSLEKSLYDKFHAIKDYSLTFTTSEEQRNLIRLDTELIDALAHDHLFEMAFMILAESKSSMALNRSQNFAQQKELTTARHEINRRDSSKQGGGFFNKNQNQQQ